MARQKDSGQNSASAWDYPRYEYKRQLPKPPTGTVVMRPMPRLENGAAVLDQWQTYVTDEAGRLHQVFEFELTQAEVCARRVLDPDRRARFANPYRNRIAAEPLPDDVAMFNGVNRAPHGTLERLAAALTPKLAMPQRIKSTLVQREPGEEG